MKNALLLFFLGFGCQAGDRVANTLADEVLELFPLQTGNRWSYWHQRKVAVGQSGHFMTVTWEQEITIAAIHSLPQGQLVERKSTVADVFWNASPEVPVPMAEAIVDLVTDNNLGHLLMVDRSITTIPNWAFDAETESLHPFYRIPGTREHELTKLLLGPKFVDAQARSRELRELALLCADVRLDNTISWNFKAVLDLDGPHHRWQDVWVLAGSNGQDNPSLWFKPGVGVVGSSFKSDSGNFENYSLLVSFFRADPQQAPEPASRFSLK